MAQVLPPFFRMASRRRLAREPEVTMLRARETRSNATVLGVPAVGLLCASLVPLLATASAPGNLWRALPFSTRGAE